MSSQRFTFCSRCYTLTSPPASGASQPSISLDQLLFDKVSSISLSHTGDGCGRGVHPLKETLMLFRLQVAVPRRLTSHNRRSTGRDFPCRICYRLIFGIHSFDVWHLIVLVAMLLKPSPLNRSETHSPEPIEIHILLPNNQRQHRTFAHPGGCAASRVVLVSVPRVSRSCERFYPEPI